MKAGLIAGGYQPGAMYRGITTLALVAAATAPAATTGNASVPSTAGATLAGAVNPHGAPTTYVFQYGPTKSYGLTTARASAGSGTSARTVQAKTAALKPGTTYHYRLVATNAKGTIDGSDRTFAVAKTPPGAGATSVSSVSTSGGLQSLGCL